MLSRLLISASVVLFILISASAQEQIKIMTYNVLYYSQNAEERIPYFRTIMEATNPDILVVQEINEDGANSFLDSVMNFTDVSYSKGRFIDGYDSDNALFYRDSLFTFIENTPIRTQLRDINEFMIKYDTTDDTLRIYAVHLKASERAENRRQRADEVDSLRNVTNMLPPATNFMACGDFNIYRSDEPAFQKLIDQDSPGYLIDPIDMPGDWHDDEDFAQYHTQSTRTRQFGGGARWLSCRMEGSGKLPGSVG